MRIAICDDQPILVKGLKKHILSFLQSYGESAADTQCDTYTDGKELHNAVVKGQLYDAVFLDINMEGVDGIEIGKYLMELAPSTLLIFVSNMENQVFRSFTAHPFRFVRKSHLREELPQVIQALVEAVRKPKETEITFQSGSRILRLNPYRILYAESNNNNLMIYTETEVHKIRYTMTMLEKQLEPLGFIRCHKGFLVNYRYIYRIDKSGILLDDQTFVPVSRNYMNKVRESYRRLTL